MTTLNTDTWTAADDLTIFDASGACVCVVGDPLEPVTPREQSIARIIIAAPDFYRAAVLHGAYEALPTERGGENGPKGRARAEWLAAEAAALAKAEGR